MSKPLYALPPFALTQSGLNTSGVIDAAAEKVAFIGRVTWRGTDTTKDIRRIRARLGAVTVGTGTNTFRASLQDVDTTTGPPGVPDGVVDQSATAATSALTGSSVFDSGALSADRTVALGELLAVVFDYSAFNAGAIVQIATWQAIGAVHFPEVTHFTAAWAALATNQPCLSFQFSDGTYGTLEGCAIGVTSAVDFNSGTASSSSLDSGDERGTKFVPTMPGTIDAIEAYVRVAGGTSDFTLAVYRDTTLLESVAVDGNTVQSSGSYALVRVPLDTRIRFAAGDNLYVTLLPTTANNVRLIAIDYPTTGELADAHDGAALSWAQRADAGAWVVNTDADKRVGAIFLRGTYDTQIATGAYALSGTVLNGGVAVSGATVRVIDRTTGLTRTATTDGSGAWSLSVESNAADRYAAMAEYTSGGTKYRAFAPWALTAA